MIKQPIATEISNVAPDVGTKIHAPTAARPTLAFPRAGKRRSRALRPWPRQATSDAG